MTNISHVHQETLTRFSVLPDCAFVRLPVVIGLLSCSRATLWRWVKVGRVPASRKMGQTISVRSVGEIRQMLKTIVESHAGRSFKL